jgi:hypothetical protein
MPTQILMPALSPTMEEGNLVKWLVAEGDSVRAGDILAEIETDKATMEFESIDDGIVGKLLVAEGTEGVKVNEPIAVPRRLRRPQLLRQRRQRVRLRLPLLPRMGRSKRLRWLAGWRRRPGLTWVL